ncbi:sugar isomerase [Paenibacillus sp. FSL R5-0490]|uniref:DUF3231 family protein n=1 Tax=Paenibacillus sp. FSL R5-0490 TaxID=1920424 RepID=UPI00096E0192|nr:DUF3231 family protein [Paenibacillus sp. FSL R5-0490]OMF51779.1 sugar isomerase [Paenibacillus sp. FSL R5-0490]
MDKKKTKLTTAEISALWATYTQNSAMICFYSHFMQYVEDKHIKVNLKEAMSLAASFNKNIKKIFAEEEFPIPKGFGDEDVNLNAPPLYTELFALSFVYRGGQMIIDFYSNALTKIARADIVEFYDGCLRKTIELYKKSLSIMLEKGIYDRPPKIEYPGSVEFKKNEPSLLSSWFGNGRPLNSMEMSELFFSIERNSIGLVLLIGLIQVSRDREVKEYLLKGKKLTERQIETFNKFLKEDNSFGIYPVSLEVTASRVPPFSEKLMLFIISASNQVAIPALATALSVSIRKDLGVKYTLFIGEILKYGNEGLKLLIARGWMENPPESEDRKSFYKLDK